MRSLATILLALALAPSGQQGGSSQGAAGGEKTINGSNAAAALDKAFRENPETMKTLSERLSQNPEFLESLSKELQKRHEMVNWDQIDPGWRPGPGLGIQPGTGGTARPGLAWTMCDASNDDLKQVISELSDDNYVKQVTAFEASHSMNGAGIHDFRMKKIGELAQNLRTRAAVK